MATDTSGGPVLEVGGLSKRYRDGTWANRDITFDVEPGELLAILGPNGAGKTTLVRQITTELVPTSGSVRVHGQDAVSDPDSVKPMLGVVPQEANLYWGLTVFHHLRLFGRLRGLSRRDARNRTDHVIESLRLQEHRDRPIEALSGGLKRRVLVGIAALTRPSYPAIHRPEGAGAAAQRYQPLRVTCHTQADSQGPHTIPVGCPLTPKAIGHRSTTP